MSELTFSQTLNAIELPHEHHTSPLGMGLVHPVFSAQWELFQKFSPIEAQNGSPVLKVEELEHANRDPDFFNEIYQHLNAQQVLRERLWFFTEELCEASFHFSQAFDAAHVHLTADHDGDREMSIFEYALAKDHTSCKEAVIEMADAFHFLVELSLFVGISPNLIQNRGTFWNGVLTPRHVSMSAIVNAFYRTVKAAGMTGNLLKAKPWKQATIKPVDITWIQMNTLSIWIGFEDLCKFLGINRANLYRLYFYKHQINQARIAAGAKGGH